MPDEIKCKLDMEDICSEKLCCACNYRYTGKADSPVSPLDDMVKCTSYELLRPNTVGELRKFLEPFNDETPLMAMNWGAFRYALDDKGNGLIQYT